LVKFECQGSNRILQVTMKYIWIVLYITGILQSNLIRQDVHVPSAGVRWCLMEAGSLESELSLVKNRGNTSIKLCNNKNGLGLPVQMGSVTITIEVGTNGS